jgi:hypothetical protein
MWFKKYWKSILGVAFWLGPIWDFIKWCLDWRGRVDALAVTYHDIGGYHVVMAYLLNPPSWLYPRFMIIGVALIWWNFRRNRRPVHVHHVEIREHIAIGASVSPVVVHSAIPSGDDLGGWEKLYEEHNTEKGNELRLRFLPDTDERCGRSNTTGK